MPETFFETLLRFIAGVLRVWLEWATSWYGVTETEETFFHRTACVIVPVFSLGLFRVERYDNTQLLDWRTLSVDTGEVIGALFWVTAALGLIAAIYAFLGE